MRDVLLLGCGCAGVLLVALADTTPAEARGTQPRSAPLRRAPRAAAQQPPSGPTRGATAQVKLDVGQPCTADSLCASGACAGPAGGTRKCVPAASTGTAGQYCTESSQCIRSCRCDGGQCHQRPSLGEPCQEAADCSWGLWVCDTAHGTPHRCVPSPGKGAPGDFCTDSHQCPGQHYCSFNQCDGAQAGDEWINCPRREGGHCIDAKLIGGRVQCVYRSTKTGTEYGVHVDSKSGAPLKACLEVNEPNSAIVDAMYCSSTKNQRQLVQSAVVWGGGGERVIFGSYLGKDQGFCRTQIQGGWHYGRTSDGNCYYVREGKEHVRSSGFTDLTMAGPFGSVRHGSVSARPNDQPLANPQATALAMRRFCRVGGVPGYLLVGNICLWSLNGLVSRTTRQPSIDVLWIQ